MPVRTLVSLCCAVCLAAAIAVQARPSLVRGVFARALPTAVPAADTGTRDAAATRENGSGAVAHGPDGSETPADWHAFSEDDPEAGDGASAYGGPARPGLSIDMQLVYGQFENMLSTISLSQEQKDVVYRLSSSYKKSNDFGYGGEIYDNTDYFENRIGFSGMLAASERLRLQLNASVENYSRGMFDNPVFRREEQDLLSATFRGQFRFTDSFEAYAAVGTTGFAHRLRPVVPGDGVEASSYLNMGMAETGGELVWSALNRVRYAIEYRYYNFHDRELDNRSIVLGEVADDFNLTEHVALTAGVNGAWSEYFDSLAGPIVGVTLKGFRYASVQMQYRYHLEPFRPERLYPSQKFVMPVYDLPPGRAHRGEMKAEVRVGEAVNMKIGATADQNSAFYTFRPVSGNVLRAETMPATRYGGNCEANIFLLRRLVDIAFGYEYAHFVAERRVTYRPDHAFDGKLSYNGAWWKVQWGNRYIDPVFIDPDRADRLDRALIGSFGAQFRLLDGLFANLRVENLYNNKYNLRDGYPEPGITVLGGLRIML